MTLSEIEPATFRLVAQYRRKAFIRTGMIQVHIVNDILVYKEFYAVSFILVLLS
jgi:hypothetical protein